MADTWTAIDFETANQDRGSACAVGVVRVSGNEIVDRFTTLIRPPQAVDFFSRHNTAVHGITAADVAAAPQWAEVFDRILDFTEGGPLVAHNASFDMGVVRQACTHTGLAWPDMDYACTLALARRTWSGLSDHRLPTVCSRIGHHMTAHHRADADAEAAARIMMAAMGEYGTASLSELSGVARLPLGRLQSGASPRPAALGMDSTAPVGGGGGFGDRFATWREAGRASLPAADPGADPAGPLYGRTVCISGEPAAMDKPAAWTRIAEAGGHPAKNVTKKTDILVTAAENGAGKTAKHRQAETYRAKGQRIEVISESAFLALLAMSPS